MRHDLHRTVRVSSLFLLATLLTSRPALAQFDLSGEWSQRYDEDAPPRGSVEIGDFTGLPTTRPPASKPRRGTRTCNRRTSLNVSRTSPSTRSAAPRTSASRKWRIPTEVSSSPSICSNEQISLCAVGAGVATTFVRGVRL
jgi:hypothetical protein